MLSKNVIVLLSSFMLWLKGSRVISYTVSRRNDAAVCNSKECREAASSILSSLDTSADPCNDFYQYACGGWIESNPIPEDSYWNSHFRLATERNKRNLRNILQLDSLNDREAIRKAKIYYKTCIDEDTAELLDAKPVLDFIQELGGIPLLDRNNETKNLRLETFLAATKYDEDESPVIKMEVKPDDMNNSRYIITLDQPRLIMPTRTHYFSAKFNTTRSAYIQFLRDFFQQLWRSKDEEEGVTTFNERDLHEAVDEIFLLESELASIFVPDEERVDILDNYNKMKINSMPVKLMSDFDWLAYLNGIMDKVGIHVELDTDVVVYSTSYLINLMPILRRYDLRAVRNYVIAATVIPRTGSLSKKFRDTETTFRKSISGAKLSSPKWQDCVRDTNNLFPMPVGALYAKTIFSEENKAKALEMTNDITSAFKESLRNIEWMDQQTTAAALMKVNQVRKLIGYPDYIVDDSDPTLDNKYRDAVVFENEHFKSEIAMKRFHLRQSLKRLGSPVNQMSWEKPPAIVNAFYTPNFNQMLFPAGVLQTPFFSVSRPFTMNYGAIGNAVGHELTHGFDITGSRYNGHGNIENWWSNYSRANFENAAQCMRKQYSSFHYELAGMNVNGNRTIGENIADNGGIRSAYHAYQMWKKANPGQEFQLPGLSDYSFKQLFFLASAQIWCASERNVSAKEAITQYAHTPPVFRVKGSFQNFEKFGEAFECRKGKDEMYPETKDTCRVW